MRGKIERVVRHYTRIDARSLGLFRFLFGVVLLWDWGHRWHDRIAFYSNDGVLPNHNHLFHLKTEGRLVWSALHAFTTPGEAAVGLLAILFFYAMFTIGWKTRVFHVLSLVAMISLSARNTLAEGPGEALAIILLATTMFLPLGSRFSVDSVVATARLARETKPKHLFDRAGVPTETEIRRGHLPGWSPHSIAAAGALTLVCLTLVAVGKQQSGAAWLDGTALHKTLHVYMFASPTGYALRDSGLLGPLTRLLKLATWLVPALVLLPFPRGIARGAAAALLAIYGLTYAVLTTYGLFGGSLFAAAALMLSADMWERLSLRHHHRSIRTVIFDVDCGICFFLAKLLHHYDSRHHLLFQGNDFASAPKAAEPPPPPSGEGDEEEADVDEEERALEHEEDEDEEREDEAAREKAPVSAEPAPTLRTWSDATQAVVMKPMPAGITPVLVETTVIAVRPDGTFATRGQAVVEILRALPFLSPIALVLSLPGIRGARDWLYDRIAERRTRISVELGLNACGVVAPEKEVPLKEPPSPARVLRFRILAGLREAGALVFVAAVGIAFTQVAGVGPKIASKKLEPVVWWTRAVPRFDVLAPEPPSTEWMFVADAVTKEGMKLDLMTGREASLSFDRPFRLGGLWARYLTNIHREEYKPFQDALRRYFAKRGPGYEPPEPLQVLQGADGYWVEKPLTEREAQRAERFFRHGRGGTTLATAISPLLVQGAPQRLPVQESVDRRKPALADDGYPDDEEPAPPPLRNEAQPEFPSQDQ